MNAGERSVAIVTGLYKAFRERDNDGPFEVYDEDIVWDMSWPTSPMDSNLFDLAGVYRGHEGVRDFWRQWLMAWESIEFEVDEIVPAGAQVVAGPIHQRMLGRASGIEVPMPDWWQVWWLRDGKVTRTVQYFDRAEALKAAEAD